MNGCTPMIRVTRLDKREIMLNAELIRSVEAAPDTIITLINGDLMIVRESVEQIMERCIEYARVVRGLRVV